MDAFRLYHPDQNPEHITSLSTLGQFFKLWYLPAVTQSTTRKPVAPKTIERRGNAVDWWERIFSESQDFAIFKKPLAGTGQPGGPSLLHITPDHLNYFRQKLQAGTYKRGPRAPERLLAPITQIRMLQEIMVVIAATGPAQAKRIRAGLLSDPPEVYVPEVQCFPKPTWNWDEALQIADSLSTCEPPRRWKYRPESWNALCKATIAFWFYTGHRATTPWELDRRDLVEPKPGMHCLDIRSVKTGKLDRVPVHRQLLDALNNVWECTDLAGIPGLIPWPVKYRAVIDYHKRWQKSAGLPDNRRFSPQAWRRLHAEEMEATAHRLANEISSRSLGHSSRSTTGDHYALSSARLRLPELFSVQGRLF